MERFLLCALVFLRSLDAAVARTANTPGHRAWSAEFQPSLDASRCPQEEPHQHGLRDGPGEGNTCRPAAAAAAASLSAQPGVAVARWSTEGWPEANASRPEGGETGDPAAIENSETAYWGYMFLFVLLLLAVLACCFFSLASRNPASWPAGQRPEEYLLRKYTCLHRPRDYGTLPNTAPQSADGQDSATMGGNPPLLAPAAGQEDALPSAGLGERTEPKSVPDTTVEIEGST
ncbi:uncharacterized protein LOC110074275 [Pogona vitticeps]